MTFFFAYIKEIFNVIKIETTTITALKSLCLVSRQVPLICYPHELSEEALKAAPHSSIESPFHEHQFTKFSYSNYFCLNQVFNLIKHSETKIVSHHISSCFLFS